MDEIKANYVVADPSLASLASQALSGMENSPELLTLGQSKEKSTDLGAKLAHIKPLETFASLASDGSDRANIHFTSGTTGKPKAVAYTHFVARNFMGRMWNVMEDMPQGYMLLGMRTVQAGFFNTMEHLLKTRCQLILGDFGKEDEALIEVIIEKQPLAIGLTLGQWMKFLSSPHLQRLVKEGKLKCIR